MGLVDPTGQPIASAIEALSDEDLAQQLQAEMHALALGDVDALLLVLDPRELFCLVGLLQLLARSVNHDTPIDTARAVLELVASVVEQAREYFAGCPAVMEMIRRGEVT